MSMYILIPKAKTTQRMVNKSTSRGKWAALPIFKEAYIVECVEPVDDIFMDYPMYTQEEMADLLDNTEEEKTAWWAKLLSLFSRA